MGTRLVGNCSTGKFINGGRYTVTRIENGRIQLQDDNTKDLFETTPEILSKTCILGWAMTYPKCQGITVDGVVFLHDLKSSNFQKTHLYVGMSRVTDGKNLFVV